MPATPSSSSVPFPSSSPAMSSPRSPAPATHHSINYHPYMIHSTSSSLLSRSNSSPSQPAIEHRHRPSRSMSSLAHSVSDGELAVDKRKQRVEEEGDRRRSVGSPSTPTNPPRLRRSGTLPSFPRGEEGEVTPVKDELPDNPKSWTPSQLGRYISAALRSGETGHKLPAPLVKDIEDWVLRQRVSGRAFLKGSQEGWATSTPAPPFLPLLLSISRRLRRSSLQARLGEIPQSPAPDSPLSSVLLEEHEEDTDDADTGVRRMARAIERPPSVASSASSMDDETRCRSPVPVVPAGTNAGWKQWEAQGGGWVGRRRKESGVSVVDRPQPTGEVEQGENGNSDSLMRGETGAEYDAGDTGGAEEGKVDRKGEGDGDGALQGVERGPGGTLKAAPVGLGLSVPVSAAKTSPPPPYRSPDPDDASAHLTPSRAPATRNTDDAEDPYASLRQTGSRAPTLRSLRDAQRAMGEAGMSGLGGEEEGLDMEHDADYEDDVAGGAGAEGTPTREWARLTTARRVTLRPSTSMASVDVFAHGPSREESVSTSTTPSVREVEMEGRIAELVGRVQELEAKLTEMAANREQVVRVGKNVCGEGMDADGDADSDVASESRATAPAPPPAADDCLPTRIRELPAYLFLVGVGVGAVMVRVLFSRAR